MRILYITNDFPYPLTSGHLRHYHLIRQLSRQHDVMLLSVVRPTFCAAHAQALAPFAAEIRTFPSSTQGRTRGEKVRNQWHALVRREPIERAAVALRAAVAELRRARAFDVVIISGRRTAYALDALGGEPVVADICDADSVRLRGSMLHAPPLRVPVIALDYTRVRQTERALVGRADHLFFASARDRDALLRGAHANASVVPNGVDVDYWTRTAPQRGRDTIIFTGAMHYPPNADAAVWLAERILPLVRQQRPAARLLLVGRDPPPHVQRVARHPGVVVTGSVPDVRPFLEQATVFVAPLRFGAGIQNKVLEALAMELPVVASPLAEEGVRPASGERAPLDVAHSPHAFAQRIIQHLAAGDTDATPQAGARAFVLRNFQWEQSGAAVERVLTSLV